MKPKAAAWVVASVVLGVGNAVTWKRLLNAYTASARDEHAADLEFFVNQFNLVLYIALAACAVLATSRRRPRLASRCGPYTVMALLDAAAGFCSSVGGGHCDGSLQVIINQCVIPCTMLVSALAMPRGKGRRFSRAQCAGAATIVLGASVGVLPHLPAAGAGAAPGATTPAGVLVYLANVVPSALSNVYKESALSDADADGADDDDDEVLVLSCVVTLLQFAWGFAFLPVLALPGFGGLPPRALAAQWPQGWACFADLASVPGAPPRKHPVAPCAGAEARGWLGGGFATMWAYALVNFAFNIAQLRVTQHADASTMCVANALALPLTQLAFASAAVMGARGREPIAPADLAALALVSAGFGAYARRAAPPARARDPAAPGGARASFDDAAPLLGDSLSPPAPLPIQMAGGSMLFVRAARRAPGRARANSDPGAPKSPIMYDPIAAARRSQTPRGKGGGGSGGATRDQSINSGDDAAAPRDIAADLGAAL